MPKFLSPLDLNKNELQNPRLHNLSTPPSTPVLGQLYYDTDDNIAYFWNGSTWVAMSGSNMSGADIINAINAASGTIDIDNLNADVVTASELTTALGGYSQTGHSHTPSEVGLGNVTNDAQVKKIASSTAGNIPTWSDANGNLLTTGYSVETTLTGGSTAIARADAVKTYVDGILAASDAMVFKGTIGTGGTYTITAFNALTVWNAGWAYKVIEAGTIRGKVCEIGDMLIATVDRASAGVDADWMVVQTNTDGAVTGPISAVSDNFATYNGTTGKIIKDSGYNAASFAPAGATRKYAVDLSTSATSYIITHNLNTMDCVVTIREIGSPYAAVLCDVEFTSVNTATIKFASAPTANTYRVVIVG